VRNNSSHETRVRISPRYVCASFRRGSPWRGCLRARGGSEPPRLPLPPFAPGQTFALLEIVGPRSVPPGGTAQFTVSASRTDRAGTSPPTRSGRAPTARCCPSRLRVWSRDRSLVAKAQVQDGKGHRLSRWPSTSTGTTTTGVVSPISSKSSTPRCISWWTDRHGSGSHPCSLPARWTAHSRYSGVIRDGDSRDGRRSRNAAQQITSSSCHDEPARLKPRTTGTSGRRG
jgi:hypothetical protein